MNHFDSRKFGKKIKEERNKQKLTQEQLADLAHVDKNTIGKYENGDIPKAIVCLYKIVNTLDFSFDDLFNGKVSNNVIFDEYKDLSAKGKVIIVAIMRVLKEYL